LITTQKFIDESHITKPWLSHNKNKYKEVIDNKEIISYFAENKPFFYLEL